MILLHESSHAVAGALLGYRPTQLPFAVDFSPTQTPSDAAVTAITGPLFSLVTGLIGVGIDRAANPLTGRPFWRLVWLWTVFASVQEGFGYFFIVGILPAGDTATAFAIWQAPTWAYYLGTAVGVAGLFLTARLFSTPVSELSSTITDKRAIAVWPWLYGTLVAVVLQAVYVLLSPAVGAGSVVAVIAGTVSVGVYAPLSMIFGRARCLASASPAVPRQPRAGYLVLGVLVAVNLILTRGWWWP
jgi:hypothetical protein